jgi:hypothetical protein
MVSVIMSSRTDEGAAFPHLHGDLLRTPRLHRDAALPPHLYTVQLPTNPFSNTDKMGGGGGKMPGQ